MDDQLKQLFESIGEALSGLQSQVNELAKVVKEQEQRIKELEGNDVMNVFKSFSE